MPGEKQLLGVEASKAIAIEVLHLDIFYPNPKLKEFQNTVIILYLDVSYYR